MKNKTILTIAILILIANFGKAHAFDAKKFGPILDGDQMEISKKNY